MHLTSCYQLGGALLVLLGFVQTSFANRAERSDASLLSVTVDRKGHMKKMKSMSTRIEGVGEASVQPHMQISDCKGILASSCTSSSIETRCSDKFIERDGVFLRCSTYGNCSNYEQPCMPVCNCQYGTPLRNASCAQSNPNSSDVCSACRNGYHLQDRTCVENQCVCKNGIGTNGSVCNTLAELADVDHRKRGPTCDPSKKTGGTCWHDPCFDWRNAKCVNDVCLCRYRNHEWNYDGKCTSTNEFVYKLHWDKRVCLVHGGHICAECDVGFHRVVDHQNPRITCEENTCACKNGTADEGREKCTPHNVIKCTKCDDGFRLLGQTCVQNICTCTNGDASTGSHCLHHGSNTCHRCNKGYHLLNQTCVPNRCTCMHGIACTGSRCLRDGSNMCQSCHQGYYESSNWPAQCVKDCRNYELRKTSITCWWRGKQKQYQCCNNLPEGQYCKKRGKKWSKRVICIPGWCAQGKTCITEEAAAKHFSVVQ